jgi:hypothetical protein
MVKMIRFGSGTVGVAALHQIKFSQCTRQGGILPALIPK